MLPSVQVVRGAFYQGKRLGDSTSEFRSLSHVQLAVSDSSCIRGWFLPPGQRLLEKPQFEEAERLYKDAVAQRTELKQRVPAKRSTSA